MTVPTTTVPFLSSMVTVSLLSFMRKRTNFIFLLLEFDSIILLFYQYLRSDIIYFKDEKSEVPGHRGARAFRFLSWPRSRKENVRTLPNDNFLILVRAYSLA